MEIEFLWSEKLGQPTIQRNLINSMVFLVGDNLLVSLPRLRFSTSPV